MCLVMGMEKEKEREKEKEKERQQVRSWAVMGMGTRHRRIVKLNEFYKLLICGKRN